MVSCPNYCTLSLLQLQVLSDYHGDNARSLVALATTCFAVSSYPGKVQLLLVAASFAYELEARMASILVILGVCIRV